MSLAKRLNVTKIVIGVVIGVLILLAVVSLIAAYRITYPGMRDLLSTLYGAGRTARYFSVSVFQATVRRIREMSAICLLLAVGLLAIRKRLEQLLASPLRGLILSFEHFRRMRPRLDATGIVVLSLVTAVATFLRIAFVRQPIRYDEATTVLGYASKPLFLGLSLYNEPNNHLFHTLLVHWSIGLFGITEWSVRLPALLAGVMLPLFTFALVRKLADSMAAYFAAAFVATSSVLVEFSTNARGYTIICVLTIALVISGLQASRRASPAWFALFSTCAVLGCWTIPLFVFPLVGTAIWLFWETTCRSARFRALFRGRLLISITISGMLSGLLYLPVVLANGPAALFQNKFVSPLRGQVVAGTNAHWRSLMLFLSGNASEIHRMWNIWNRDLPRWWPLFAISAFGYSLVICRRFRHLTIALAGWVSVLFVARQLMLSPRNWLMFLPLFISGVAIGLSGLVEMIVTSERMRSYIGATASAVLVLSLAYPVLHSGTVLASTDTGVLFSAKDIAAFLQSKNVSAEDVICSYVSDIPLQYYWWNETGKRQPNTITSAKAVKNRGVRDAWVIVNKAYGESLEQDMKKCDIETYQILEQHVFKDAILYHVNWQAENQEGHASLSSSAPVGDSRGAFQKVSDNQ